MDEAINFDSMWMWVNRKPSISVKLQLLKSMEWEHCECRKTSAKLMAPSDQYYYAVIRSDGWLVAMVQNSLLLLYGNH